MRPPTSTRLVDGVGETRLRDGQADLGHGRLEQLAVLGGGDGLGVGADHLDAEALQDPALVQGHGQVEGGLAAEGRQHGVGALALDDGGQHLGGRAARCRSRSANSGSVMMVAGLELARMTR